METIVVDSKYVVVKVNGEIVDLDFIGIQCDCGEEYYYGCHGNRENKIYSEYYCEPCYNKRKRTKT